MANLNSEAILASSSYVCGERKGTPHALARLASPGWLGPGPGRNTRVRDVRVNGLPNSAPRLAGVRRHRSLLHPDATAQRSSPRLVLRPSPVLRHIDVCNAVCYAPFAQPLSSRQRRSSFRRQMANDQYVSCYLVQCLIMFSNIMFILYFATSMIGLFMLVLEFNRMIA